MENEGREIATVHTGRDEGSMAKGEARETTFA